MSQPIYPTVVTTDDIFQYGESESTALQVMSPEKVVAERVVGVTLSHVLEPVYEVSSTP